MHGSRHRVCTPDTVTRGRLFSLCRLGDAIALFTGVCHGGCIAMGSGIFKWIILIFWGIGASILRIFLTSSYTTPFSLCVLLITSAFSIASPWIFPPTSASSPQPQLSSSRVPPPSDVPSHISFFPGIPCTSPSPSFFSSGSGGQTSWLAVSAGYWYCSNHSLSHFRDRAASCLLSFESTIFIAHGVNLLLCFLFVHFLSLAFGTYLLAIIIWYRP